LAARDGGIWIDEAFIAMQSHPFNGRNSICPQCGRGCYRLYLVAGWACRHCHRLRYSCRHRRRTIPGLNRLLFLRRRIGAPEATFAPSARPPLHARRLWGIVAETRPLKAALVGNAGGDAWDALARRLNRAATREGE